MKTCTTTLLSLIAFIASAQAAEEEKHFAKDHPCARIVAACKAAGFAKGEHDEKKGLWMDCFKPIMAGQAVNGVKADPADVQACQAKKDARKEKAKK